MKKKLLAIISATATVGCAFAIEVKINPGKKFQTIEYFGASDAWATQYIGDFWSDAHREKTARLLFSQKLDKYGNPEGAGLSLWRVNLGGGTFDGNTSQIEPEWRAARSFLPENSETPDWSRCAGLRYFMEKARDYGCGKFMLFSNTPPIQWTLNGKGYAARGNPAANLKPEAFGKFANYMADAAKRFIEAGYNIEYISPVNEPQCPWDYTGAKQEGSPWRCSDMKKILEELDRAIGERNIGTKILFGETAHHVYNYADKSSPKMPKHWENLSEEERPALIIQKFFDKSGKFYIGGLKHLARQLASHGYHTHTNGDDDTKAVSATAFLSPNGGRIVAVFVNMKDSDEPVSVALPQKFANAKRAVYITDGRRNLALENSADGSAGKISLYPHSITTVVFDAR